MRLATWNVNSIRARLPRVVTWTATRRPDVLCLQELKCQDEQFPREPFEDLGYSVESFGQKTYNGVAILSRIGIEDVARGLPGDPGDVEARVIAASTGGLRVINAYVVNGRQVGHEKYHYKLGWLARLARLVEQQRQAGHDELAVVGDFNVTFDERDIANPEAWAEQILCSTPEREALALVTAAGVADAVRKFTQDKGPYTWWDFKTRGFERGDGLRIDHILLSPAALARCSGVEVDVEARKGAGPSDHAPVIATLE
ncbi:MAG TPA: exodeoxyribonuclease III [Planctomycetota bacterium]|nr:exodeoxyribonuclease III [Planctomycetota bacterium]